MRSTHDKRVWEMHRFVRHKLFPSRWRERIVSQPPRPEELSAMTAKRLSANAVPSPGKSRRLNIRRVAAHALEGES